jgi:HK97 family phage portal protein
MDSASSLLRWGNYFAIKLRGNTGPIRRLRPIPAGHVDLDEQALRDGDIRYRVEWLGEMREYPAEQIHHVRTAARDYIWGNSPVKDISDTIGLEIAAEEFGGSFFGNGAMPLLMFLQQKPFKDKEQEDAFLKTFQAMYGGGNQHKALLIPAGIEVSDPIEINNERSQFLATRQYQRTVIAGAFGVPPHLVGDLTSGTFNNVEQQDKDFVINVVLPFARIFENAMERDLLTDADRRNGIIIRFDLDQVQRADFRTRRT